jgi:hypothetical protein
MVARTPFSVKVAGMLKRARDLLADVVGCAVFTVILVGAAMIATPWGERFADFIDRLAAR